MFFLLTHIFIGKHYPKLLTQFIVGCILYIISITLLLDITNKVLYDNYKYYIYGLICIDTIYFIYVNKNTNKNNEQNTETILSEKQKNSESEKKKSESDGISHSQNKSKISESILISSSDINDYKIEHIANTSDNSESIFVSSVELS